MGYLVLAAALLISGIAAWYSIVGLEAIFAAAQLPIIIMGASLEIGKLVTASWLYQNWKKVPFILKSYLTGAVIVLMFITSMGIFGFLSKAHIDQTISTGDNTLQIKLIDNKIAREQARIKDAETVLSQLDKSVQTLIDFDRIRGKDGAIAVRESQKEERDQLTTVVDEASDKIATLQQDKLVLSKEQLQLEAEVGPLKYIAEFIYDGQADKDLLEAAVRWVIITIIFVFDPLAVLLIIAANMTFNENRKKLTTKKVVTFTDIETPPVEEEREVDLNEDNFENMTESDLDLLIKKYEMNPKSQREGTFLNMKYKKLVAYRKSLELSN